MPSGKHGLLLWRHSFLLGHTIVNLRREMSKQRERYVLNLDQNIQKGINKVKSQFFEAASDGKLTFKLVKNNSCQKTGKIQSECVLAGFRFY